MGNAYGLQGLHTVVIAAGNHSTTVAWRSIVGAEHEG